MQGGTPVLVLNTNTKRENGRKAQLANINAAKVTSLHSHINQKRKEKAEIFKNNKH